MTEEAKKYAKDERDRFVAHILEQHNITLYELWNNPYLRPERTKLLQMLKEHPEF